MASIAGVAARPGATHPPRERGKDGDRARGLELAGPERKALLKRLKSRIGSGGTLKDDTIELQGDQVDQALLLLGKEGFRPRRAGG